MFEVKASDVKKNDIEIPVNNREIADGSSKIKPETNITMEKAKAMFENLFSGKDDIKIMSEDVPGSYEADDGVQTSVNDNRIDGNIQEPEKNTENNIEEVDKKQIDDVSEIKEGGAYKDLPSLEGKERHHMPADATTELLTKDGPCIIMDIADHRETASCGYSKDARKYRAEQKELNEAGKFEEALQMDIDDIKEKFGDKYDSQISEMKEYVSQLKEEGKI